MTPRAPFPIRRLLLSLAMTAVAWAICSWPLPRHLFDAIPSSAHSLEFREMIPGDHLQLLYHFWLIEDMIRGETPWFYNLYEFNHGSDADRYAPGPYYMPFSLVYAAGSVIGGRAFGWNLTGFVALWLTAWITWIAMRRWTSSEWVAAATAAIALTLPHRWAMQLGGSPSGLAMLWPPLVFLGVDIAIRDRRILGGVLAGIGILFAAWTDAHVYFFSVLFLPVFAFLVALHAPTFPWRNGRGWLRIAIALLPIPLFIASTLLVQHGGDSESELHGRSLAEVAIFSPSWPDFFIHRLEGTSSHVYLGFLLPLAILLGAPAMLLAIIRARRHPSALDWRPILSYAFALAAIALVLILTLGPNGPDHAAIFRAARRFVPPYAMIRQPAKIFCLLPLLAGLAVVLSANACRLPRARLARPAVVAFGLLLLLIARREMRVSLSGLDLQQGAYAAVAADAAAGGSIPRAVVLPLWPGNSHYASVYQHYVSLYRIRMLNGYRPFVPASYGAEIFAPFAPLNAGIVTDAMLDALLAMDIRYILLHENLYPEKVSPFPVSSTINLFDTHPRLQPLAHDKEVWAWQILPATSTPPLATPPAPQPPPTVAIARRWELERYASSAATRIAAPDASQGAALRLTPGAGANRMTPELVPILPELRWALRARGTGSLDVTTWVQTNAVASNILSIDTADWSWFDVPLPPDRDPRRPIRITLLATAGNVDADLLLLAAGQWPDAAALTQGLSLPARTFFHAGYSDLPTGRVTLLHQRERAGPVFYGPKWPLPRGRYEATLIASSPQTPAGTTLGDFSVAWSKEDADQSTPVRAGEPTRVQWSQDSSLPVNLVFNYNAAADLIIERVDLKRLGN